MIAGCAARLFGSCSANSSIIVAMVLGTCITPPEAARHFAGLAFF